MYTTKSKINSKSNLDETQLSTALAKFDNNHGLKHLIPAVIQAESKNNINAVYLIAHALVDSGSGKTMFAKLRHNYFFFHHHDEKNGAKAASKDNLASLRSFIQHLTVRTNSKNHEEHTNSEIGEFLNQFSAQDERFIQNVVATMNKITEEAGGPPPDGFPQQDDQKKPEQSIHSENSNKALEQSINSPESVQENGSEDNPPIPSEDGEQSDPNNPETE